MSLSLLQKQTIHSIITESLKKKLARYSPETKHMPFHHRLLGKDRMALFSFIHSLNTTFGTSIFEPVAETIAQMVHVTVKKQYVLGTGISKAAQSEIQSIVNDLTMGKDPDKLEEIERIRSVCNKGKMLQLKPVKVDILIKDDDGIVHLFDLKTAKPNISNFKDFKRTILEWIAIYLADKPYANVMSYIAIPYNPYYPNPYERWTVKGMLDVKNELKVAEELWNFFGAGEIYDDLLNCFEKAGNDLRSQIDEYFSKFK